MLGYLLGVIIVLAVTLPILLRAGDAQDKDTRLAIERAESETSKSKNDHDDGDDVREAASVIVRG